MPDFEVAWFNRSYRTRYTGGIADVIDPCIPLCLVIVLMKEREEQMSRLVNCNVA
jgi:hypothetical protein